MPMSKMEKRRMMMQQRKRAMMWRKRANMLSKRASAIRKVVRQGSSKRPIPKFKVSRI